MSNAAHLLEPEIRAAAEAIGNARSARRGAAAVFGLLDVLPDPIFSDLVADARAAVAALALLRAETPPAPRRPGPLNRTDAAALGLDLNAGSVLILARDRNGVARAVAWAVSAEAVELNHRAAQHLWTATAEALVRLAVSESLRPTREEHP